MSRFYASIQGNRGVATRCGSRNSGITGHIRGWYIGARVEVIEDEEGEDLVRVYKTGGSCGRNREELIAEFKSTDNTPSLFSNYEN